MHTPGRGEGALRRYRASLPNTSYFLTLCTEARAGGLNLDAVAETIRAEIAAIETDLHWMQRACVLMPDHAHLFVRVTGELPVSRCVARLKSKTRATLLAHGISWQANFFEHRLRPDDKIEDIVRYIFLNPFHARLVPPTETYRWFWLGRDEAAWFKPTTDEDRPLPEWLQ